MKECLRVLGTRIEHGETLIETRRPGRAADREALPEVSMAPRGG